MEAKRFDVKTSLLNELRLFQLMLKKKRKMNYNVTIDGPVGKRDTIIFVMGQEVTLDCLTYHILKNQYKDRGLEKNSLIIHYGVMELNVKFESTQLEEAFYAQK
jgi:hypothetical protein